DRGVRRPTENPAARKERRRQPRSWTSGNRWQNGQVPGKSSCCWQSLEPPQMAQQAEHHLQTLVAQAQRSKGDLLQRSVAGRREQPHLALRVVGELLVEEIGRRYLEEANDGLELAHR